VGAFSWSAGLLHLPGRSPFRGGPGVAWGKSLITERGIRATDPPSPTGAAPTHWPPAPGAPERADAPADAGLRRRRLRGDPLFREDALEVDGVGQG
jgi:hypothetical protein